MLRLPRFNYLRPATAHEAARMAAELGPRAMFVAGGTDLLPKLKRRQFEVDSLIGLDFLPRAIRNGSDECVIDAGVTLAHASHDPNLNERFSGYAEAAGHVSSPPLRNAGTIGGNLCVDTRCNYYDMTYEWRKAAGFCLKKDGDICLVAPSSPRCWAVSSSDTAPMAIALGGVVTLVGASGERELPVTALYRDDGDRYMAKQPDEVVTGLRLRRSPNTRSAYVKLRRRGSIDFPIAGAAVAVELDGDRVESCRIVLSAVASYPLEAKAAEEFLKGRRLQEDVIREAGWTTPISVTSGAKGWSAWWSSKLLHEQATSSPASTVKLSGRIPLIHHPFIQKGQGMVEYALILALVALIVLIALIATGGQLLNLYSNITATMCNYHVGC
ncbi:MAG: 4-hydroxybenzoyl-CoA reductase [Chloroflexi bacterium]|nr:MAG: 4-hydroxybenzoyl-CoA reductase [Chloroflexota bacterium]